MRSLGNKSILRLEDLDLIPEQFQSHSSGAQAKCRLFAAYLQTAYCRVFCMYFLSIWGCFYYPQNLFAFDTVLLLWFVILLWSLHFIFSIEDNFRFRVDHIEHIVCPIFSSPQISVVVAELFFFWGSQVSGHSKQVSRLHLSLSGLWWLTEDIALLLQDLGVFISKPRPSVKKSYKCITKMLNSYPFLFQRWLGELRIKYLRWVHVGGFLERPFAQ